MTVFLDISTFAPGLAELTTGLLLLAGLAAAFLAAGLAAVFAIGLAAGFLAVVLATGLTGFLDF
jgi:hypothetical protein